MAKTISPEDLAAEISVILEQFKDATEITLKDAVDASTKEIVAELRETSPKQPNGGDYAKSWTRSGNVMKGRPGYARICYVKSPHYRLTHLLEYGHALWQGGRAKPHPHIAKAEQAGIESFERKLVEGLKK